MTKIVVLFLAILVIVCANESVSAQQKFTAYLNGAQHVPAVSSTATGSGVVLLNAEETEMIVTLRWNNLTSPAFAAHLHGPAAVGENGPVLFNMLGVDGVTNTVTTSFTVTAKDVQLLKANRLYFNIHNPTFPNGEIRGQVKSINIKDDIDGDGRSDLSALRLAPPELSITQGFVLNSFDNSVTQNIFPFVVDQSLYGDFNSDGRNDIDAIRIDPPTGNYIHNNYVFQPGASEPLFLNQLYWGNNNLGDVPVGGNFDGDVIPDTTVYRKETGSWWIFLSSTNTYRVEFFGGSNDIPVPSDYDKDGITDLAVVRKTGGSLIWYIKQSSDNSVRYLTFGLETDSVLNKAFWVDFDGDGAADPAVVRKVDDKRVVYALKSSTDSLFAVQWGLSSDKTKIVDADGDGRSDLVAIRRSPESGGRLFWYIWKSSDGQLRGIDFGLGTDAVVAVD